MDMDQCRGDLAGLLGVEEGSLPPSLVKEELLLLNSLRDVDTNYSRMQYTNMFIRIKWEPPIVDLLRDNPLPPVKLPAKAPPASSPYRLNIRPRKKPKIPVSVEKRAQKNVRDMLVDLEVAEEKEMKAKEVIKPVDPLSYHLQQAPVKKKKKFGTVEALVKLIAPQQSSKFTAALSTSVSDVDYAKWRSEVMSLESSLSEDLNVKVILPSLDLTTSTPHPLNDSTLMFPELRDSSDSSIDVEEKDGETKSPTRAKSPNRKRSSRPSTVSGSPLNRKRPRSKTPIRGDSSSVIQTSLPLISSASMADVTTPTQIVSSSALKRNASAKESVGPSFYNRTRSEDGLRIPEKVATFWETHTDLLLERTDAGTGLKSLNVMPTPIELSDEMERAIGAALESTGSGFWNDEIGSTIARPLSASAFCARRNQEARPGTAPAFPVPVREIYESRAKTPQLLASLHSDSPSTVERAEKVPQPSSSNSSKRPRPATVDSSDLISSSPSSKRARGQAGMSPSSRLNARTSLSSTLYGTSIKLSQFRYSEEAHEAAYKIQRVSRQRWNMKRKCCIRIQKTWRGFLARRLYRVTLLERHAAATMCQKVIRGRLGRLRAKNWHILKLHYAAARIQALYRGRKARARVKVLRKERRENAACCLQRAWRCYVARTIRRRLMDKRRLEAAKLIQRQWRGHYARKLYNQKRKEYLHFCHMVQRNWRGKLGRRMARVAREKRRHDKATLIQKRYRKHLEFVAKKKDKMARRLQRVYRGHLGRTKAEKLRRYLLAQEEKRRSAEDKFIGSNVDRAKSKAEEFWKTKQGKDLIKVERKVAYARRQQMNKMMKTMTAERLQEISIREAFHMFDQDGSGNIDKNEFKGVTRELATPMSNAEIDAAMKLMDVDGNGTADYQEFKHWYKLNMQNPGSGGALNAMFIAGLKARKLILDTLGTTDDRMARRTLMVREVEKARIDSRNTFRKKHPPRFSCPKCDDPFTFVNEIDDHFKWRTCKVVLEEEEADPVLDKFFKVQLDPPADGEVIKKAIPSAIRMPGAKPVERGAEESKGDSESKVDESVVVGEAKLPLVEEIPPKPPAAPTNPVVSFLSRMIGTSGGSKKTAVIPITTSSSGSAAVSPVGAGSVAASKSSLPGTLAKDPPSQTTPKEIGASAKPAAAPASSGGGAMGLLKKLKFW